MHAIIIKICLFVPHELDAKYQLRFIAFIHAIIMKICIYSLYV